jgi:hypothetical protein
MGRHKDSGKKRLVEQTLDEDGNVTEEVDVVPESAGIEAAPLSEARVVGSVDADGNGIPGIPGDSPAPARAISQKQEDNNNSEIERLRAEVEALKSQLSTILPLDELLKDKYFGTTSYLIINRSIADDPKNANQKMYVKAQLSAFPDCIDKLTGKLLAPDLGFDNREEADALRESKEPYKMRGRMTTYKEAISTLRREYYEKRIKSDRDFLNQAILARS